MDAYTLEIVSVSKHLGDWPKKDATSPPPDSKYGSFYFTVLLIAVSIKETISIFIEIAIHEGISC